MAHMAFNRNWITDLDEKIHLKVKDSKSLNENF